MLGFFTTEVPMPKSTEPLTPAQVYRFAIDFCQPHLAFRRRRQGHRRGPPDGPLRRRGAHLLDLRDLPPTAGRPLRGDLRQRPLRQPLLPRAAQAPDQRRLRRPPAQAAAPAAQAAAPRRRRPDPLALLRPAIPWTAARSTAARPRPAPARSSPTPPPTWSSTASGSPWP